MQKYVLMSTNWPDTRGFFPSKTSISFKIRHKLTLLPYMSNILCLYKQFALYFEWKCHIFGKNWCTGEPTFHRWIGEIISPVFYRCTGVQYLTLARTLSLFWCWQFCSLRHVLLKLAVQLRQIGQKEGRVAEDGCEHNSEHGGAAFTKLNQVNIDEGVELWFCILSLYL